MSARKNEKALRRRRLAKEVLIKTWTPLVRAVVKKTAARAGWHRPTEDHYAAGMLGLVRAINRYDGTLGAKFMTHAWNCVRFEVLSEIRGATYFPTSGSRGNAEIPNCRIASIDSLYIPMDAGDRDDSGRQHSDSHSLSREVADSLAHADDEPKKLELADALRQAIDRLPESLRRVIIDCDLRGMTQEETAAAHEISQPAVFYQRKRALKLLRNILKEMEDDR